MTDRARVASGRTLSFRPLLLLALLSAACSGGTPGGEDAPLPAEVVPNRSYATSPTPVAIHGSRFLARATQQAGGGAATLDTRHRAWLGELELQDVTWVSTTELTATVPAGLPVGAQKLTVENALGERGALDGAFTVLSAPSLAATVAVDKMTVSEGQAFQLSLTVTNAGSADVTEITLGAPRLSSSDGAAADPSGAAPTAPATLAAGASQTVTWTFVATTAGHLSGTVGATGRDTLSGATLIATPPAAAQVTVQTPPHLQAELSIPRSLAISRSAVSNEFTVAMTITNSGDADALAVTPSAPSVVTGSTATASLKAGTSASPDSAAVPAGQAVTFAWTYIVGTRTGSLRLSGGATGKDGNSDASVTADAATSNSAQVGNAAIMVAISAPAHAAVNELSSVVVTFSNPGTVTVNPFALADPSISSPDPSKVTLSGPTPTPVGALTLQVGTTNARVLTWNVSASVAGRFAITFSAIGTYAGAPQPIDGSATVTIDVSSP